MPAYDQTGPAGMGPMTGRGLGRCGVGRGMGMGMRMGWGRCRRFGRGLGRYFGWNTPQTKKEKIEDIQAYKKALQEEMEGVEEELSNLQKQE